MRSPSCLRTGAAVACVGLVAVFAVPPAAQAADGNGAAVSQARAATPLLPLKTSPDGHFLVDQKGQPFLVVGDSPWSLVAQPREADLDRYLDDRAKKGFNSLIVNLIEHKFGSNAPNTRAGL